MFRPENCIFGRTNYPAEVSDMRRILKKIFECGHKGFGEYCHRCEHFNRLKTEKIAMLQEKMKRRSKEEKFLGRLGFDRGDIPLTVAKRPSA